MQREIAKERKRESIELLVASLVSPRCSNYFVIDFSYFQLNSSLIGWAKDDLLLCDVPHVSQMMGRKGDLPISHCLSAEVQIIIGDRMRLWQ